MVPRRPARPAGPALRRIGPHTADPAAAIQSGNAPLGGERGGGIARIRPQGVFPQTGLVPTASELVGGLSRAGIVERAEDPANRRRILVSLAEDFRPPLETFVARRTEPLLRALDGLSPGERAGFLAGLTGWVREVQGGER